MTQPTAERVKELLHYCPESGVFVWKISTSNRVKVGDVAGSVNGGGYLEIRIDGKLCRVHRLAWLYVNGEWPTNEIDHINGVRTDNRFTNLRAATKAENGRNTKKSHDNTSGFKGVSKCGKKWVAYINLNGNRYYLGYFTTAEAASASYEGAAALLFGQWRRITVTTVFER